MKFYKLDNTKIQEAKNKNPIYCHFADGEFSYYVSHSNEELKEPFVKMKEDELPEEFINSLNADFINHKANLLNIANMQVSSIQKFKSNVLGEVYTYDFSIQDQANIIQAKEYANNLDDTQSVGIRCTSPKGIKDNYPHNKSQINTLFNEWYAYKSKILDAFSTLKIDLENDKTITQLDSSFSKFKTAIGG